MENEYIRLIKMDIDYLIRLVEQWDSLCDIMIGIKEDGRINDPELFGKLELLEEKISMYIRKRSYDLERLLSIYNME